MRFKILAFVKSGNKYLALRNNPEDPKHGGDFWYVVTGNVEKGENLEEAVRREIMEETGLAADFIYELELTNQFEYDKQLFEEYCFLAEVSSDQVVLNNENIDYQWLSPDDFIRKIQWFGNKAELKSLLK